MQSLSDELKKTWLISLIGFCLTIGGIVFIAWNEGRAVHYAHSLDEVYENVIPLNVYEPIRAEFDGRLVHLTGNLLIDEPLTEPEYGVAIQAVKLKRRVQMFQWIEERSMSNYDNTEAEQRQTNDYYYVTEWRDKLVNSNSFYIRHGHRNPTEMPLKSHVYVSPSVRVGQFVMGAELKEKFNDYQEMTSDDRPERRDIKLHLGIYYHSDDVWNPEVGDIRVQFYSAGHNGDQVSIVALQKDGVLVPYETVKKHQMLLLRSGSFNAGQMIVEEHRDLRWDTWKMRGIGLFMLFAATTCLAGPINILYMKSALLRKAFREEISASRSFLIALSVTLFVVAIAWSAYRPWIAFGLFGASFTPFFLSIFHAYNETNNAENYYNK